MPSAISIDNLEIVIDGKQILSGIKAEIPTGKAIGLIGPSGAGKTTLMRSIVGLQHIHSGHVSVLGEPAGSASLHNKVGYSTQEASVYNDLTVKENLDYFALLLGNEKIAAKKVAEQVEISALGHQLASTLSGGERARLSLAVALLRNPKLLVLDEPTVGLDPLLRNRLWKLFHSLTKEGVTLLVSSHVMDEADRCDELLLLRGGHLLAQGTPDELVERAHATSVEDAFIKLVERTHVAA
jgi:ABC-2 type transport system ATP-binding protein